MTEPLTFPFNDDGTIPNSRLPLLVYRAAVPADAAAIERIFAANRWPPAWRDGCIRSTISTAPLTRSWASPGVRRRFCLADPRVKR